MELTADIQVEQLITEHPQASGFLAERGIVCIRCGEPYWGTLRELAAMKGLAGQVETIVRELQAFLAATDA